MKVFGTELRTPEDVRDWLGSHGGGLPPNYDGPADALRYDADDAELSIKGMILAVREGTPMGRSEGIRGLRGVGGPLVDAFVASVLTGPVPTWWNDKDPLRSGTFADQFISMCLFGEAPRRLPAAVLERSAGTAEEEQALFMVLSYDPNGPGVDRVLSLLAGGQTWPPLTWHYAAHSIRQSARCAELMAAIRLRHDRSARDALVGRVPALGEFWA
ncbi:MAG: hypothetical protein ACOYN0_16425 [Phycisphaerales bacterium]|jgi:hypothetical protein